MNKYTKAVREGIKWLDKNAPKDWRQTIEFETLDLSDCEACIIGQIFGDYLNIYSKKFNMSIEDESEFGKKYGFNIVFSGHVRNIHEYNLLKKAWEEELIGMVNSD